MRTDHIEHPDPALEAELDPTLDAHRFSSEAARPKTAKRLLMIFGLLAAFLAVIGTGGLIAKRMYTQHMSDRTEKRADAAKASETTSRKGKQFPADVPPLPAAGPASAALPVGFAPPKAATAAIPLAGTPANAPVLASTPPAAAPAVTRKPSMMLEETAPTTPSLPQVAYPVPAPAPATATGAFPFMLPATAPAAQHATVQDLARSNALKSPLTTTPQSSAARLGDRSLLLARGSYVPCALETDLNSNVPGPASCIVTTNVFSDDGRVVLLDKGARVQGEYRNTLKQGDTRIAVLWHRIKTPTGIVVDVDSPATDGTGAVGVVGDIDNHWMQRIGAAFLLSVVQDVVTAKTQGQEGGNTVINTTNTSKSMSEKVLDSTINIPPTLTRNRGERLMILVNRDLWFDSVYALGKRR